MNWKQAMRRRWAQTRDAVGVPAALFSSGGDAPTESPVASVGLALGPSSPYEQSVERLERVRKAAKIRSWRRRVLIRRGATMHSALGGAAYDSSLAMLDEMGMVVSWYGSTDGRDRRAEHVVDRHVAQFYKKEDVDTQQPLRDLHEAAMAGTSTRQGWYRRAEGAAVWATSEIKPLLLRDGRLQGFSFLTCQLAGPPHRMVGACPEDSQDQTSSIDERGEKPLFLASRNRMARTRDYARQRRLASRATQSPGGRS